MSTLNAAYLAVRSFHLAFGQPAPDTPTMQTPQQVIRRADWITSELDELEGAPTLVDQADAYIDILYFAIGGLVELGVEPSTMFDIVQAANMAKLDPDGKPIIRADGKVLKPEGWERPEPKLAAEIERQIAASVGA